MLIQVINELFNVYATYETGAWLFAAELNLVKMQWRLALMMI